MNTAKIMAQQSLTVSELTRQIKYALEIDFDRVYLRGEISGLALPRSGHAYFNVKDEGSQIAAVMFRSALLRMRFDLKNGIEVLLKGRVTVYEPQGRYQLIVDRIEPLGVGALQVAFEQLKAKLSKEGLFDAEHKKPIPFIPQGIGIVTSSTGAVIRDIVNILNRRFSNIPVLLNPVSVQGEGAATEIARAIRQFQSMPDIDLLIVGRGGGSIEDLWSFNEEIVARAIFHSDIPIISAVGHEIDFTIADFVADLRAPTPSAAAELSVPEKDILEAQINQLQRRLNGLILNRFDHYRNRLEYLKKRLRTPEWVIQAKSLRVDDATEKMEKILSNRIGQYRSRWEKARQSLLFRSPGVGIELCRNQINKFRQTLEFQWKTLLDKKRTRLQELMHVLESVSPLSVLNRGYAVAADADKKPITSIRQVEKGSTLFVHVSDGTIHSKAEKTTPKNLTRQTTP